jgi:hypothetical protein
MGMNYSAERSRYGTDVMARNRFTDGMGMVTSLSEHKKLYNKYMPKNRAWSFFSIFFSRVGIEPDQEFPVEHCLQLAGWK